MKKNLLLIVLLLIVQNIFSQTGGRRFFTKKFSVNITTPLELTDDLGQSLSVTSIYKVQLVTTGTGTKTGAEYLVWNNLTTSAWEIRAVSLAGNSSNHPLLVIESNIVKVYTKHTTKYTVNAFVEEIVCNEDDSYPSIFGAAYQWQRDGAALFYDGNVGIGTTNPTSKLTVAGNINSREVKVTVDAGADFVFENNYNLPSLDAVDRYIKEHKHLPEIASADGMKKDGINLSEMNIKLLQKMEEMTLYMIEQNKQIKELKNENENFKLVFERLLKIEQKLNKN